jgi:putative protein-disulfide isomerase
MRKLVFILIIAVLMSFNNTTNNNKPRIIYVYDALCGWCYGFSPVISQLYTEHKTKIEFEVLSGGMITGDRIGPIGEVAPYIKWAYKDVENATGVKFGDHFLNEVLENGKAVFTSIPLGLSLTIFKEYYPERAIEFAADLQKAVYFDGLQPLDTNGFIPLFAKYGIGEQVVLSKMSSQVYLDKTQSEFLEVSKMGV